jgi:hypothetical protein
MHSPARFSTPLVTQAEDLRWPDKVCLSCRSVLLPCAAPARCRSEAASVQTVVAILSAAPSSHPLQSSLHFSVRPDQQGSLREPPHWYRILNSTLCVGQVARAAIRFHGDSRTHAHLDCRSTLDRHASNEEYQQTMIRSRSLLTAVL